MKSPMRIRNIDELIKYIQSIKKDDILYEPKVREMLATYTASQIKKYNESVTLPIIRGFADTQSISDLEVYILSQFPTILDKMLSKSGTMVSSQMLLDAFFSNMDSKLYEKVFPTKNSHDYDDPCGDSDCSECYPDQDGEEFR